MRVLIIDGSSSSDEKVRAVCSMIDEVLTEKKVDHEIVHLEERKITPCKGCRGCWIETPGLCKEDDDENALNRSWMASSLVILLTRMTYGGYSSRIKSVLDKHVCFSIPYLTAGKETSEHLARYETNPSVLGIAVYDELNQSESETFKMLVKQNGRTLHSYNAKSLALWSDEDPQNQRNLINSMLMAMKVRA